MVRIRYAVVGTVLLLLAAQGLSLATTQQERSRKIYTNEDVERAAPSQPATPTPGQQQAPAAEPAKAPTSPAETTAAPATQAPTTSEEYTGPLAGLQIELKLAQELQLSLDQYLNYYPSKVDEETDPDRKSQLETLVAALMNLIQQNSRYISDLEQRLAEQPAQAASQQ